MFFIYGNRATKIAEENKKINDNGVIRQAIITIHQRYAHFFWIPLFPYMRDYLIQIPETGEVFSKSLFKKMPEPYLSACKEVSQTVKTPIWTFIGVFILVIFIILVLTSTPHK